MAPNVKKMLISKKVRNLTNDRCIKVLPSSLKPKLSVPSVNPEEVTVISLGTVEFSRVK